MNITVRGKNIEVTPALRDYVEKRVSKVTKYFSDVGNINAALRVEKNKHYVEVTVPVDGIFLRAQEVTDDMYSSIDLVIDKIERQIRKHKTKLMKRFRGGSNATSFKSELIPADIPAVDEDYKIIRTKRFSVKPMTVEEAVMQMDLLNHDFFVYYDADDKAVSVVYKRADGDYGLLLPELK